MRVLIFLFFSLIGYSSIAQVGVRSSFNFNQASEWNNYFSSIDINDRNIFDKSISFSLDYWMRLPQKRIEFYPYISYHSASSSLSNGSVDLNLRQIGLGVNTHIYFLDFVGDCDCPTWSKQGDVLKKGLFALVGIGTDYSQKKVTNLSQLDPSQGYSDGNLDLKLAVGIGFDVGLNDLVTVSPIIQYQYYPDISWHELPTQLGLDGGNINSPFGQLQIGVRLGFRFDYE